MQIRTDTVAKLKAMGIAIDRDNHGQARAVKGGEFGANGEFYEGGKFLATTEAPKSISFRKGKLVRVRMSDGSQACGDELSIPADVRYTRDTSEFQYQKGGSRTETIETITLSLRGRDLVCTWFNGVPSSTETTIVVGLPDGGERIETLRFLTFDNGKPYQGSGNQGLSKLKTAIWQAMTDVYSTIHTSR